MAFGLTLADLIAALEANNLNVGAGYIERNGSQYLVRVPGQVSGLRRHLRRIPIASRDGVPVTVADVAEVALGEDLRTGAATMNGDEVVLGTVLMLVARTAVQSPQAAAERWPK